MPTYDFICPRCEKVCERYVAMLDRNKQYCRICHAKLDIQITVPRLTVWKPDWYYVSTKEKVWCDSKRQLFDECKKRNKYAVCHGQENKELPKEEVAERNGKRKILVSGA